MALPPGDGGSEQHLMSEKPQAVQIVGFRRIMHHFSMRNQGLSCSQMSYSLRMGSMASP